MAFNYLTINQTNYADALLLQEVLFEELLQSKGKEKPLKSTLIFLQHSPVYTLGKSGDIKNLKVPIEETGAEYFKTNRGGDITYHGPGQLTAYPIFDLEAFGMGVRQYVETLEDCVIDCIATYGLKGSRIDGASGVWLDPNTPNERKICAVGIKVSRGVTMHGLAFNINTDLSYFDNIVPCGLEDKGVSSLANELGREMDFVEVEARLLKCFEDYFKVKN
tara:strand:- start:1460 stop:2119 length:660 start_codon:yes stop_codon:yes gene_type:complete